MPPDQTTAIPPTYQLPPQPTHSGRRRVITISIAVIVVILVLIAGVVAALFYYPPAITLRSALTMPQELKDEALLRQADLGEVGGQGEG